MSVRTCNFLVSGANYRICGFKSNMITVNWGKPMLDLYTFIAYFCMKVRVKKEVDFENYKISISFFVVEVLGHPCDVCFSPSL